MYLGCSFIAQYGCGYGSIILLMSLALCTRNHLCKGKYPMLIHFISNSLENEVCGNNPCAPGICSVNDEGRFQCDCEGTFHTGERCETGFLQIPSIPVLRTNTNYDVSMTSSPQIERELTLTVTNISALNIVSEGNSKVYSNR